MASVWAIGRFWHPQNVTPHPLASAEFDLSSDPAPDRIIVNDSILPAPSPLKVTVTNAGDYTVGVIKEGYQQKTQTVHTELGQTNRVPFGKLVQLGSLDIFSIPDTAEIFLDSAKIGQKSPVSNLSVDPNIYHLVEARFNGYSDSTTVKLEPGESKAVHLELKLDAFVQITSDISNADVYVDGIKNSQKTPVKVSVSPGVKHTIAVTNLAGPNSLVTVSGETVTHALGGWYADIQTVSVAAGQTSNLFFILKPQAALLDITSTPTGAVVYLDGLSTHLTTPDKFQVSAGVKHNIMASLNGASDSKDITAAIGETQQIHLFPQIKTVRLSVKSVPAGAILVSRSGDTGVRETNGVTPGQLDLKPGGYFISASLDGYVPTNQFVRLEQGSPQEITFYLRPAPDYLSVYTSPEGATVFIDNVRQPSLTPAVNLPVTPGIRRIRVELDGYPTTNQTVMINSTNTEVKFILTAQKFPLLVKSTPSDAEIWVGGISTKSITPATLQLLPGIYSVTLKLPGYYDEVIPAFEVKAGQTPLPISPTLRPIPISVTVRSDPSGAEIRLDQQSTGKSTPGELVLLPGSHMIQLKLPGYYEDISGVEVKAGQAILPVSRNLLPIPIKVTVSSAPQGAAIWLDQQATGKSTPGELDLPPGNHTIQLHKEPDYYVASSNLTVSPGHEPAPIHLVLVAVPQVTPTIPTTPTNPLATTTVTIPTTPRTPPVIPTASIAATLIQQCNDYASQFAASNHSVKDGNAALAWWKQHIEQENQTALESSQELRTAYQNLKIAINSHMGAGPH
jgi:hypothetical protein